MSLFLFSGVMCWYILKRLLVTIHSLLSLCDFTMSAECDRLLASGIVPREPLQSKKNKTMHIRLYGVYLDNCLMEVYNDVQTAVGRAVYLKHTMPWDVSCKCKST